MIFYLRRDLQACKYHLVSKIDPVINFPVVKSSPVYYQAASISSDVWQTYRINISRVNISAQLQWISSFGLPMFGVGSKPHETSKFSRYQ